MFDTPGEYDADWAGSTNATWALLVFRDATDATFQASSPHGADLWTQTETSTVEAQRPGYVYAPHEDHENKTQPLPGPFDVHVSFPPGRSGSIYILADRIEVNLHSSQGLLSVKDTRTIGAFTRDGDWFDQIHRDGLTGGLGNSVVVTGTPQSPQEGGPFNLKAQGASHIEWYDADITCPRASPCPTGGGPDGWELPVAPGYAVRHQTHTYEALLGEGLDLHGHGTLDYVVFGAVQMDLGVQGSIRLPLASGTAPCEGCVLPDNQTFSATGNITLHHLQPGPGGLQADLDGDVQTARFDEQSVDASLLGLRLAGSTFAAVAATAGGYFLAKALGALFTRLRGDAVLEQPRRRLVYEAIVARPGTGFRELARETNLSYGVVRHHLDFLLRNGKIIERHRGSRVHFFENHGKYETNWARVAALADDDLRHLHDWIQANPGRTQQEVAAAMAVHGWSASATQRSVVRLVNEKLAVEGRHGRFKTYRIA